MFQLNIQIWPPLHADLTMMTCFKTFIFKINIVVSFKHVYCKYSISFKL